MNYIEPISLSQRILFMNYIARELKKERRRVRVSLKNMGNRSDSMTDLYIEERTRRFSLKRYRIVSNPYRFPEIVRYEVRDPNLTDIVNRVKEEFPDIELIEFYH